MGRSDDRDEPKDSATKILEDSRALRKRIKDAKFAKSNANLLLWTKKTTHELQLLGELPAVLRRDPHWSGLNVC